MTIKSPYAQQIIKGVKKFEIRSWPTKYRGTLVITVSKDPVSPESGTAIGLVDVVDCRAAEPADAEAACLDAIAQGSYAWVLENPRPIAAFPVKGKLGIFNLDVPADLLL